MSKFNGYKPFVVIKNVVNKLESQGLVNLAGDKNHVIELVTQELIQDSYKSRCFFDFAL